MGTLTFKNRAQVANFEYTEDIYSLTGTVRTNDADVITAIEGGMILKNGAICGNFYAEIKGLSETKLYVYISYKDIDIENFNTLDICGKSEKGYFIGAPITTISIIYPIVYLVCFYFKFAYFDIIATVFFILVGLYYTVTIII